MHEVSIAESLLNIIVTQCKEHHYTRVEGVKVKIGKASGVMPEALLFAFDALKIGTLAEEAVLAVEEVPVSGHCNTCNLDFSVSESYILCCPHCSGHSFQVKTGRELEITELEVY